MQYQRMLDRRAGQESICLKTLAYFLLVLLIPALVHAAEPQPDAPAPNVVAGPAAEKAPPQPGEVVGEAVAEGAPAAQARKTLAECVAIAERIHPSLRAAAASVQAGAQRVSQATAGYLPQLQASYAANRRSTTLSARTGVPGSGGGSTFNFFSTGVSLTQVLFDFGQNLHTIRAAQASEASLEADARTQLQQIVFGVKQAYFNLLAARRLRDVARDTVAQNKRHLDDAKGRREVGLATKFDVTRSQVELANSQLDLLTAENSVAVAVETLRNALGLAGPLDFDIVDTLDFHEVRVSEQQALESAYTLRPELQSLRAGQQSLREQIAALEKDYLPNVTGNAVYDWSGTGRPTDESWNVGASVNLSIFNGGLTTAQLREARAKLSNLEFNEEAERQNVALEVRQAVLDLHRSSQAIDASNTALVEARENLELAEGRYRTGVGTIIELTDAQAAGASASARHVQALYSYQIALAAVEKATAHGWTATPIGDAGSDVGPAAMGPTSAGADADAPPDSAARPATNAPTADGPADRKTP